MGEVYSTPGSNSNQGQASASSNTSQNLRQRETLPNGSHNPGLDNLTLDAISRLHGGNSQLPPGPGHPGTRTTTPVDHLFNSPNVRTNRSQDPPNPGVQSRTISQEELFAAQLCGQLTPPQLNALAAVYHQQQQQQQQQIQRPCGTPSVPHASNSPFAQVVASGVKSSAVSPTFSLGPMGNSTGQGINVSVCGTGTAHTSRSVQLTSASHSHHQKRPPSRPTQYTANMGAQTTGRPSSATQSSIPQHAHQRGQGGGYGLGHSTHLGPSMHLPGSALLDPNSAALLSGHNSITVCRSSSVHHTTSLPSAAPSPSPGVTTGYQGRRSQLGPPSGHPNKRPRLNSAIQHQSSQHNLPAGTTACHAATTSLAAGMDVLMSSAAATKAIASLASNPNFLNSAVYSSVTEAAAAALTPFFSAAINNAALSGNVPSSSTAGQSNTLQPHLSVHHARPPSTTATTASGSSTHSLHQQQSQQQPQGSQQAPSTTPQTQGHGQQQHVLPPSSGSYTNPLPSGRTNYGHIPTGTSSHQNMPPNSSFSGQTVVSTHPSSAHLTTKSSHVTASLPPVASRLPSGHLQHTPHHLGTSHPTPHGFNATAHGISQSGTPHHVIGHSSLPQGSGVLRQQTKEPAYHPQVEAISPAPEESRLTDAQDAKLHREREEISRLLTIVNTDITKQETLLRHLCERENRLAARLAAVPPNSTVPTSSVCQSADHKGISSVDGKPGLSEGAQISDMERTYENPIQSLISENRQKARQHHMTFQPLCGPHVKASPYALPLYRQPSDLSSLRAIRSEFRNFRSKLIHYLRRRRRAEHCRIQLLAQQYARNSVVFTKKVEKLLTSTKRRQRDLRHREIFEKTFPEVKRSREDREANSVEGTRPTSVDGADPSCQTTNGGVDTNQTTLYDPVEEMNKMEEYAIDPPLVLAPWQRRYRFICQAGLVTECRAQLQEAHDISKWTDEERQIFRERFLATPKNFPSIASFLEGKSVAECIRYYYLSKKTENYKQLLKKHTARRRRAAQSDRTGGGGAGATGSGSGGPNSHLPNSGSYTNGASGDGNVGSSSHDAGVTGSSSLPHSSDSSSTKDNDQKHVNRKDHSHGGRTRPNRGRPTGSHSSSAPTRNQHAPDVDDHPVQHKSRGPPGRSHESKTEAEKESKQETKLSDKHISVLPLVCPEGPDSVQTKSEKRNETVGTTCNDKTDSGVSETTGINMPSSSTVSTNLPRNDPDSQLTDVATSSSSYVVGTVISTTSSTAVPTCIKDIIHSVIQKSLSQPSNCNASDIGNTTTMLPGRSMNRNRAMPAVSQSTEIGFIPKNNATESLARQVHEASRGSRSQAHLARAAPLGQKNASHTDDPATNCLLLNNPTSELCAAAARLASESVNSTALGDELATVCLAAAAAAAVATAAVTVGNDREAETNASTCMLASGAQPNVQAKGLSTFSDRNNLGSHKPASEKLSGDLLLSCSPASDSINPVRLSQVDVNSSKAILFGDFLTAQQLERAESNAGNSQTERTLSTTQYSRSINPATLPIPIGPRTRASSGPRWIPPSLDTTGNNDFPGLTLSAENATWLAIHAQAAAAAAAAANNATAPSTSSNSHTDSKIPNASLTRSTYSPLSPSPLKSDQSGIDRLSPVRGSRPKSGSSHSPVSATAPLIDSTEVDRLNTFINNAQQRYTDEVECYRSRDRSDSMRTLTSSETSQFVSALHAARQQYHEKELEQQSSKAGTDSAKSAVCGSNYIETERNLDSSQRIPTSLSVSTPPRPHSSGPRDERSSAKCAHSPPELLCVSPTPSIVKQRTVGPLTANQDINDVSRTVPLDAAFRRRGYTESQINRRFSGSLPGPSITPSDVMSCKSAMPSVVSNVNSAANSNFRSLNPATYIDVLIQSHLNRPQIHSPHATNDSDPASSIDQSNVVDSNADPINCEQSSLSAIATTEGASQRGQPDISVRSTSDSMVKTIAVDSDKARRSQLPAGKGTLEEQINKAIAEEIWAQIKSKERDSTPVDFGNGGLMTNPRSPLLGNSCTRIPLKKRGHNTSYLLSQNSSDPKPPSNDPLNSSPFTPAVTDPILGGVEDKKEFTLVRPNGTRISHEIFAKSLLDTKTISSGRRSVESSVEDDGKALLTPNNRANNTISSGDSGHSATAGDVNNVSCAAISSPSSEPQSPSLEEVESPGKLQIDLAAADMSPPPVPTATSKSVSPKQSTSSASGEPFVRVTIPMGQPGSCRSESSTGAYAIADCSPRLNALASHPKNLTPLLTFSGPDMLQFAQSKSTSPKSSPRSIVHQPT